MKPLFSFVFLLFLSDASAQNRRFYLTPEHVKLDTLLLRDSIRQRTIPVAFYSDPTTAKRKQIVIISHGYNVNQPGSYLHYRYLGEFLAAMGYFVVSIQHELPTDSLLPTNGNPRETRWTNWVRGAENIHFVLTALKKMKPKYDYKHVALIGHSNGGDMSVLFAHRYGNEVEKVITLDNRRMDFPRVSHPAFLTLRSNEFEADAGVLPTEEEIKKFRMNMKIIRLPDTRHGEMSDAGTAAQKGEIHRYIFDFLR